MVSPLSAMAYFISHKGVERGSGTRVSPSELNAHKNAIPKYSQRNARCALIPAISVPASIPAHDLHARATNRWSSATQRINTHCDQKLSPNRAQLHRFPGPSSSATTYIRALPAPARPGSRRSPQTGPTPTGHRRHTVALRVPCPTLTSILGPRSEACTTAACLWPRPHLAARVRRPACLSTLPRARAPAFPLGCPRRHPPADAKLRSLARARRQTLKARSPFFSH